MREELGEYIPFFEKRQQITEKLVFIKNQVLIFLEDNMLEYMDYHKGVSLVRGRRISKIIAQIRLERQDWQKLFPKLTAPYISLI